VILQSEIQIGCSSVPPKFLEGQREETIEAGMLQWRGVHLFSELTLENVMLAGMLKPSSLPNISPVSGDRNGG
jgi:hypothetical protein